MHIQWFPGHMTKALRMMEENVKLVDCLIYVLDSRCIAASFNPKLNELAGGKPILYVLNKADLVEREDLNAWIKYFKDNKVHGKIINLSSVRGIRAVGNGGMGNVGYCATKGAVEMLTKAYASDLGPTVQVNAIGPTITYTPMMVGLLPDDETSRNNIAAAMPAKRIGYPDDCKGPAIFLASAASDFVTGSTIYPDGGLTNVG